MNRDSDVQPCSAAFCPQDGYVWNTFHQHSNHRLYLMFASF